MTPRETVDSLLKEHGATLKRSKNHEVWELPNGSSFTRALTPGDIRSDDNSLSTLRRALGITKTEKTVGDRREKKTSSPVERTRISKPTINCSMRDALLVSGVKAAIVESEADKLRAKVAELEGWKATVSEKWWFRLADWMGAI